MNKTPPRSLETVVLIILIFVGIAASLIGFAKRFSVEARNKRVETVIDYSDALGLALAAKKPLNYTLRKLNAAGITTLAIAEDPLDSLRVNGLMRVEAVGPSVTLLTFGSSFTDQERRVIDTFTHKTSLPIKETGAQVKVGAPYTEISQLGIGLDPMSVSSALANKFLIAPRLLNYPGATPDSIYWMLDSTQQLCGNKANVVIFDGADVLGNRSMMRVTAAALESSKLLYGSVEFGKQIGDIDLSRLAAARTVRVHSIGGNEMPTMDEPTAVGRFGLAARERTIRVCYVRLFLTGITGEPDLMTANTDFILDIRRTLAAGGLELGAAHGLNDPKPSRLLFALMSLGAVGGALLLLRQFTGLRGKPFWIVLAACLLAGIAMAMRQTSPVGREVLALIAAIAFPTLGLLRAQLPKESDPPLRRGSSLLQAAIQYVRISSSTFAGIVLVVGLLADRLFMIKVFEFAGIRAAVFSPILLVALYYGFGFDGLTDSSSWHERVHLVRSRWLALLRSPLLLGQVIFGVIGLAIVAVVLIRSGNDPGVGVSSTELGFRALLNKLLIVRPRTKEFLFGHPLLFLGLALAFNGRRKEMIIFLLAGAIGQASLLNTFCHIHTPLVISLLRALIGLVLGGAIGLLLFVLAHLFLKNLPSQSQLAAADI